MLEECSSHPFVPQMLLVRDLRLLSSSGWLYESFLALYFTYGVCFGSGAVREVLLSYKTF